MRSLVFALLASGAAGSSLFSPIRASRSGTPNAQNPIHADSALGIVNRGIAVLGGPAVLARAGGVRIDGRGSYDLGVRLQGMRPDEPQLVPLDEQVAVVVDSTGISRVALETRTHVNPDAEEWIRTLYNREESTLLIDLLARRAFRIGRDAGGAARQRAARMVPHVMLAEAAAAADRLSFAGTSDMDGQRMNVVRFPLGDGPPLTLYFDAVNGLLHAFEYPVTMPVRGGTTVRWTYDDYRAIAGLGPYPGGHTIRLGGQVIRRVTYTDVRAGGAGSPLFSTPESVVLPPTPPPSAAAGTQPTQPPESSTPAPQPTPRYDVRTLAPGVFLAPNVRSGFHHLFVEFADFVLVVDATAPWHELHEIPSLSSNRPPESLGTRLIDIVRSQVPAKPIRYLALTHHHDDHAGGAGPFVAAGATILATETTRPVVERIAPRAEVEIVLGDRTIADSTMEVRLIDVGENPHADGMLAVWLPRQRLLYVSDLWEPTSERFFPSRARTLVMRWFVGWLDRSDVNPDQIFAIHGSARVTPEQIALIRAMR